ncbi:MAG TPA: hypothetical protein VGY30_02125 [Solirubrobacteraceae bacterium]|jgi:hypothetical protein|nr:hypothetical protein [Solirubrobacteraceae bacterium]
MHAVLVEVDTSGQPDAAVGLDFLRKEVVPRVSGSPGFQAGYWLRPLDDGKGTSVVVFDTEANAQAAAADLQVGGSAGPSVTVIRKEIREIAASA